ncbi:MAG TPA: CHAT domain-containing protein [Longimicrobium sp.]
MRDRLKVLFLAADPFRSGARLELGEEMRAIDEAIQRGSARGSVELVSHFATRTRDLQYALLRHEPHVVHFAGHGAEQGAIYLGDENGQPRAVGKEALGRLFCILDGEVRAVVLNGCHTLAVAEEVSQAVDFAVGTRRRISDGAAIGFAAAFYTALAFGRGVRQAFDLAVNQLQVDGSADADVPVLRVRDGVEDRPVLAVPGDREEEGTDALGVHQTVRAKEIGGEGVSIIADDLEGPGVSGDAVRQVVDAEIISGTNVSITGRKIRRG